MSKTKKVRNPFARLVHEDKQYEERVKNLKKFKPKQKLRATQVSALSKEEQEELE